MLRSEEMACVSLYFNGNDIYSGIKKLAESGILQLKKPKPNVKTLKNFNLISLNKIEKLEHRLYHLKKNCIDLVYCEKEYEHFDECSKIINESYEEFNILTKNLRISGDNLRSVEEVLVSKIEYENFMQRIDEKSFNKNSLNKKYTGKAISNIIYNCTLKGYLEKNNKGEKNFVKRTPLNNSEFVIAVIPRGEKFLVRNLIKDILKNNCYIELIDIDLEYSINNLKKSIIISYAHGKDSTEKIKEIILTVCNNGNIMDCGNLDLPDLEKEFKKLKFINIENTEKFDKLTNFIRSEYGGLKKALTNERKIYESINCLKADIKVDKIGDLRANKKEDSDLNCTKNLLNYDNPSEIPKGSFLGEGWIIKKNLLRLENLTYNIQKIKFAFEEIPIHKNITDDGEKVPTYIETNKFTSGFQNLTNVFGIPKYGEINPGIFMIFTFPFMFGSMFGDVLHGLFLLTISLIMIKYFNRLNHNCGVIQILLEGRYIILTCSIASVWFGFLYSDFGSLTIKLFSREKLINGYKLFKNYGNNDNSTTYPFGINPIWHSSSNSMAFTNNLKMKLSLVIGFVHMEIGSLISIMNCVLANDKIELYCVVLPQVLAFTCFLGYLVFLCIYKWLVTVNHPSLVGVLISMYTEPFTIHEKMYNGQLYTQLILVCIILLSIPWMLFSKPCTLILMGKVKKDQMLDLWINSGIHTIEFSLGLISNTCSYLRIWAVTLAHGQLTSVMHQFTIGSGSYLKRILLFPIYIFATLTILIGLEGLSACLHALRLNWIEFFSKFYKGGGEEYKPLSFKVEYDEIYEE